MPLAEPLVPRLPSPVRSALAALPVAVLGMALPGESGSALVRRESLSSFLGPGDILLFETTSTGAAMQRRATASPYDHIAIIVPPPSCTRYLVTGCKPLWLLEVTGDGTGCYPLLQRLDAYMWTGLARRIVARRVVRAAPVPAREGAASEALSVPSRVDSKQSQRLAAFAALVSGRPYSLTLSKLVSGLVSGGSGAGAAEAAAAASEPGTEKSPEAYTADSPLLGAVSSSVPALSDVRPNTDRRQYFCSELVAAAWMEAGIIARDKDCAWFWPKHFINGAAVELMMGPCMGLEDAVEIDPVAKEIGVASTGVL
jgi:hypothetical protein